MAHQRDELTIHVHPAQGDDTSSGAADGPLRTLAVDGLRPVDKPALI